MQEITNTWNKKSIESKKKEKNNREKNKFMYLWTDILYKKSMIVNRKQLTRS